MEVDLVATPLQHGRPEIVIQNHARLAGPGVEGVHVPAQEVLHGLVEEELQIQRPRVRQRDQKAGELAPGTTHHHLAEVGPVNLRLLVMERVP